jgi:hypothetical protein
MLLPGLAGNPAEGRDKQYFVFKEAKQYFRETRLWRMRLWKRLQ